MRISDWSSDVCSSDLAGRKPQLAPAAGIAVRRTLGIAGQERAGPDPGRGDDRATEVAGAAHVSSSQPVSIRLLDREYTVGCEPDERDSLLAAAKLLDSKMREIRGGNRMAALDRVAVLAALNFAHELQQLRNEDEGKIGRAHV